MTIYDVFYNHKQKSLEQDESLEKYDKIVSFIQKYITETYSNEFQGKINTKEVKERYKILIQKIVEQNNFVVSFYTEEQLVEAIYNSMVVYDFLTPYINGNNGHLPDDPLYYSWEEINANRFDDIEIVASGKCVKLKQHFSSAKQCVDIVKRIARVGGLNLDMSKPRGKSFLGNGIRIQVTLPPCIDEEAGAIFSIRRQKSITNDKNFFIQNGTSTKDQLDFLVMCLKNKISVGIAGSTGCGKTTDMNYLLREAAPFNRIYTVEDTREFDCVIKGEDGRYISRVSHTVTRESEEESLRITATDLVIDALRYDPDIIGLGEMRGKEAKPTIDAGCTDHTIITGLHAGGQRSAYRRITSLYMDAATNLSEQMVYENIVEAIPIIVHKKAFRSGERRYMAISEATVKYTGLHPEIQFNTIFRYVVEDFKRDENENLIQVIGHHEKVGDISNDLAQKLFENGVPIKEIKRFSAPTFTPSFIKKEEDL